LARLSKNTPTLARKVTANLIGINGRIMTRNHERRRTQGNPYKTEKEAIAAIANMLITDIADNKPRIEYVGGTKPWIITLASKDAG
jgi:hypothetical protein